MTRDSKFWVLFVVFQVFFGLAVFAVTREYYQKDEAAVSAHPWMAQGSAATQRPAATPGSAATWSQGISSSDLARLSAPAVSEPLPTDPVEISRQANEAFVAKRYDRAAVLYEQLLEFDRSDAEIYNNLGITLHYLGRSDEALRWLNDGVGVDPEHQRIWLTLGFVNAQLGNFGHARTALTKASEIGGDESIRQSATRMLAELP
jgi:tetratricopeptide (TPR) repeat protein